LLFTLGDLGVHARRFEQLETSVMGGWTAGAQVLREAHVWASWTVVPERF
jgi:hypothetical protein